jgi:hypothetical protein
MTSQNQEKLLFSALGLLVHFRESLHEINGESLLSEKLFGRAPARFSREGALPNGAYIYIYKSWHYIYKVWLLNRCFIFTSGARRGIWMAPCPINVRGLII